MKINLNFETEYNQFYITNGSSVMKERTNDIWEDSSFKNRIYVEKGFIAVRTASYGNINLEVKLLKEKSNINSYDGFDHVIESYIEVSNSKLQIRDCPDYDKITELNLKNGIYTFRIYFCNLKGVDIDEEDGNDSYVLEIWKEDELSETKVLKQFND